MKVFAIITLANALSRAGSDRWGPFVRPHGAREHLWHGRKLTPEEFNAEFPKALRFAGPDRPLVGRILVEPLAAGEGGSCLTMPVADHEAKIAEIQAGVNAWVAEQNQKLVDAGTRIAELEQLLAQRPVPATEVTEGATPPTVETIPEASSGPVPAASEGSAPVPAGAQVPEQPKPLRDVVEPPKAAPAAAKKGPKAK